MAGLFDALSNPQAGAGLLGLGAGLLSGGNYGNFGSAAGRGLLGFQDAENTAQKLGIAQQQSAATDQYRQALLQQAAQKAHASLMQQRNAAAFLGFLFGGSPLTMPPTPSGVPTPTTSPTGTQAFPVPDATSVPATTPGAATPQGTPSSLGLTLSPVQKAQIAADQIFNQGKGIAGILGSVGAPLSTLGKLNDDFKAGRITQDQFNQALDGMNNTADPATIQATAQLIANYKEAPLTSYAMSRPIGARIMAEVQKLNPNYDAKLFTGGQNAVNAFFAGPKGDTVRSFNVAINHLDTLGDLSNALQNGDVQSINSMSQKISQEFGVAAPTNFDAAKQLVSDEIVKAIVGSGGGVQDRESAAAAIGRAQSPQQLSGVINTYKNLLAGQIGGFRRQYQSATGRDDFDKRFLSGSVAQMVNSIDAAHENGGTSAGSVPKITSADQYGALPAGAHYIAPDGSLRVKGQ